MCDCEPADFWHETHIKRARKAHRCYECGDAIPIGTSYIAISAKWGGDVKVESFGLHHDCDEWRRGLERYIRENRLPLCECIALGTLREALEEFCCEVLFYNPRDGRELPRPLFRETNHFFVTGALSP